MRLAAVLTLAAAATVLASSPDVQKTDRMNPIIAAQETAQRLQSPILDAEHLLSALVEPDDGIPAETLRRLGVDLPAFRGELAAELNKRARIQGGSLSLDPRAKASIDRAEAEARRLGDDYVSTEHLLLGVSEAGGDAQALLERHDLLPDEAAYLVAQRAKLVGQGEPGEAHRGRFRRHGVGSYHRG